MPNDFLSYLFTTSRAIDLAVHCVFIIAALFVGVWLERRAVKAQKSKHIVDQLRLEQRLCLVEQNFHQYALCLTDYSNLLHRVHVLGDKIDAISELAGIDIVYDKSSDAVASYSKTSKRKHLTIAEEREISKGLKTGMKIFMDSVERKIDKIQKKVDSSIIMG